MKTQILAGLLAVLSATNATPIEERATTTCGVVGYDRSTAYDSTTVTSMTFSTCSSICQNDSKCVSFSVSSTDCNVYKKAVASNYNSDSTSPFTFYDKACPAPTPVTKAVAATTSAAASSTTTISAAKTTSAAAPLATFALWKPAIGDRWHVDLSTKINVATIPDYITIVDGDLESLTASIIKKLKARNIKIMCYFSAGTYENWRTDWTPDTGFNASTDLGNALPDWEGEWYVDVRKASVRAVMQNRINLAASKGCDAIDPDNIDAYGADNGLGLTVADLSDYTKWMAVAAANKGLSFGLKNAPDLISDLLPYSQWVVQEACHAQNNCDPFNAFIKAGKPVFNIEYVGSTSSVSKSTRTKLCGLTKTPEYSTILKDWDLDEWTMYCDGTTWGSNTAS